MDSIDRAILERLQVDGRIANVDLADAVNLSPSACLRRVRALEESGLIAGYRAELDRARLGLQLTVFVQIKVEGHSQDRSRQMQDDLTSIPAVVACFLISGETDFLVEVAAPTLPAYERILLDQILVIPGVVDARSTFAIRTMKTRGPLPMNHLG